MKLHSDLYTGAAAPKHPPPHTHTCLLIIHLKNILKVLCSVHSLSQGYFSLSQPAKAVVIISRTPTEMCVHSLSSIFYFK